MKFPTLLLLLFCSSVFAQTDFFKVYYPHIDSAEVAFSKEKYNEAVKHYRQAFKNVEKPLARDIYNAVVCNTLKGDFDSAKPLLIQLAKKGISTDLIESQALFQESNPKANWEGFKPFYQQILASFKSSPNEVQKEFVEGVNEDLKEMSVLVEEYRKFDIKIEEFSDLNVKSDRQKAKSKLEKINEKYWKLHYQFNDKFIDFLLKNHLPDEEVYGIAGDGLEEDKIRALFSGFRFYVYLHTTQNDSILGKPKAEMIELVNDKLMVEVGIGNIHRDYVLRTVKDDYKMESLYFKKVSVPKEDSCGGVYYFVNPKPENDARYFDVLLGGSDEIMRKKGWYSIFGNHFFLMHKIAIFEEWELPNCDELKDFKLKNQAYIP